MKLSIRGCRRREDANPGLNFERKPLYALRIYSLQVPANRMGSAVYSVVQLKTIQEVITLTISAGFSAWFLGQPLKWNHYAAFALIVAASFLMLYQPGKAAS